MEPGDGGEELGVRRATLDDLDALRELWQKAGFDSQVLMRRVTDFQIAAQQGRLVGAAALQIRSLQGWVHHFYVRPDAEAGLETISRALWRRLLTVASNHGVVRLWAGEEWPGAKEQGFGEAGEELAERKPVEFPGSGRVLTLQLKEEVDPAAFLERELELFKSSERTFREQVFQQAQVLRLLAWLIASLCLAGVFYMVWQVLRRMPQVLEHRRDR